MNKIFSWAAVMALMVLCVTAQATNDTSIVTQALPPKIEHAEPLYIDLIRDLGARKGEREWNFATGMTDKLEFDEYEALIEYEWAPINRLGLEVELPFTFYTGNGTERSSERPSHRMEAIKTAIQWTFLVKPKAGVSMAVAYINELEFTDLDKLSFRRMFQGNTFNPFLVIARNWGKGFHTLLYTGPAFTREFGHSGMLWNYQINTNIHYLLPNTRHFVGIEFNKVIEPNNFGMVIRPQMRLEITEQIMIGIVGGISVNRHHERFSTFARLIYEPKPKH